MDTDVRMVCANAKSSENALEPYVNEKASF